MLNYQRVTVVNCWSSNFLLVPLTPRCQSPGLPKFLRRLLHCGGGGCSGGAPFFSGRFHHETWDPVTQNMLIINIHIYGKYVEYLWFMEHVLYMENMENLWNIYGKLVGGLEPWNFIFHNILGNSSSQLTNSYFSKGLKPPTSMCIYIYVYLLMKYILFVYVNHQKNGGTRRTLGSNETFHWRWKVRLPR